MEEASRTHETHEMSITLGRVKWGSLSDPKLCSPTLKCTTTYLLSYVNLLCLLLLLFSLFFPIPFPDLNFHCFITSSEGYVWLILFPYLHLS